MIAALAIDGSLSRFVRRMVDGMELANRLLGNGQTEKVPGSKLRLGDLVIVSAGELIPGDGEVIEQ